MMFGFLIMNESHLCRDLSIQQRFISQQLKYFALVRLEVQHC